MKYKNKRESRITDLTLLPLSSSVLKKRPDAVIALWRNATTPTFDSSSYEKNNCLISDDIQWTDKAFAFEVADIVVESDVEEYDNIVFNTGWTLRFVLTRNLLNYLSLYF